MIITYANGQTTCVPFGDTSLDKEQLECVEFTESEKLEYENIKDGTYRIPAAIYIRDYLETITEREARIEAIEDERA